jgi:Asp-tRNA(Asn)/Glu-tRNA(Gln) amidotransferase A subunit family amidase
MKKLTRRQWSSLIPALLSAGLDLTAAESVNRETLKAALETIGLKFTNAQIEMMLPGVSRFLTDYQALRKIDVPLDTPPAIRFSPVLPGHPPPEGPSLFKVPKPRLTSFSNPGDLAFSTALELGALVRARKITSVDLTGMYLDRLKTYSPKLLCVITLTGDLALEQAKRADAEIRAGKPRTPLHGVPYGAKDIFNTKGILTTWGAEPFQRRVPDADATVIEKLRAAGAVLVAKLSMGALAQGGLWFEGMTKTPWNYSQTSSGSSAGSASATAAGLVGFSIGTETLGSIVSPSTRCGVVGLRPTFGRVSRSGAMALSWTMDKIGPLCRSVADCAEVLRAISGPDGKDLSVIDAPLHWNASGPVRAMKIGYVAAEFERNAKRQPFYEVALADLRKTGAKLEPVSLPEFPLNALLIALEAEAAAAFDDITRSGEVDELRGQGPGDWPNAFRKARLIPAVEYIRAQRARTIYMRKFHDFMSQWDVLVSPASSETLDATNLTGHPQVVVPCGFLDGLPQGLLFTGNLFQEGAPMRLAYAFEQATDWHTKHPALQV